MPYFVFKIYDNRTFEPIDSFAQYRDAKQRTRELRAEIPDGETYTFRLIYARHEAEAERLLAQKREARPLGEDS